MLGGTDTNIDARQYSTVLSNVQPEYILRILVQDNTYILKHNFFKFFPLNDKLSVTLKCYVSKPIILCVQVYCRGTCILRSQSVNPNDNMTFARASSRPPRDVQGCTANFVVRLF